jgi:CTD small phosphatase-like protein 2
MVFTASQNCYANSVLDYLDPSGLLIHHRIFRDNCITTPEGVFVKDLRILANRDLKDVVLIDNASYSFGYQIDNGIPILPFYDDKSDVELRLLVPFLIWLKRAPEVRFFLKKTFKLEAIREAGDPETALQICSSLSSKPSN